MRELAVRVPLDWLLAAIIGVTALAFDLYRLEKPTLIRDEAWSVGLTSQPFWVMKQYLWDFDLHIPA